MFHYVIEFFEDEPQILRAWFPGGARENVKDPHKVKRIYGPMLALGAAEFCSHLGELRILRRRRNAEGIMLAFIRINALRGTFAQATAQEIIEKAEDVYCREAKVVGPLKEHEFLIADESQSEELKECCRKLISYLETKEESDSGREFHPTTIQSCRAVVMESLCKLIPRIKELSQ